MEDEKTNGKDIKREQGQTEKTRKKKVETEERKKNGVRTFI